jgi:hypothetical protein
MKLYILDAPLIPPKDLSDIAERLTALAKTCSEIIADDAKPIAPCAVTNV